MMLDELGGLLGDIGYALDTPGALLRGALAGRPGERADGRQLLESWGILDENIEGLDPGDVAGFVADILVDPMNLFGLGKMVSKFGKIAEAEKLNRASQALRDAGAMPEEIAKLTKALDEAGKPTMLHHGSPTAVPARELNPALAGKATDTGWYGAGTYASPDPGYASDYADLMYNITSTNDLPSRSRYFSGPTRLVFDESVTDGEVLSGLKKLIDKAAKLDPEGAEMLGGVYVDAIDEGKYIHRLDPNVSTIQHAADVVRKTLQGDTDALLGPQALREWIPEGDPWRKFMQPSAYDPTPINPGVASMYVDMRNPYKIKRGGEAMYKELVDQGLEGDKFHTMQSMQSREITDFLRSKGHDGVIVDRTPEPWEYVMFDQSQIYNPYIAPAMRRVPTLTPEIATLLAYNTANQTLPQNAY